MRALAIRRPSTSSATTSRWTDDGAPWVGLPKADAHVGGGGRSVDRREGVAGRVHGHAGRRAPGYNFTSNKGYGTDEHWAAIRALGPSPVHRRSFRGVASYQPTLADI